MLSVTRSRHLLFQAACLATSFAGIGAGQQLAVDLDRGKTTIRFVLGDVLHTVHGTFQLRNGHISFDPSSGAVAGEVAIDPASGNSGSAMRDKRMTRDILQADRYPEMQFSPAAFTGPLALTGKSDVEVAGLFEIHGQAHRITIPMQVQISGEEMTATGKFTVPYVQWGMKNPSTFLLKVNDKVEIDITAVGHVNGVRAR